MHLIVDGYTHSFHFVEFVVKFRQNFIKTITLKKMAVDLSKEEEIIGNNSIDKEQRI